MRLASAVFCAEELDTRRRTTLVVLLAAAALAVALLFGQRPPPRLGGEIVERDVAPPPVVEPSATPHTSIPAPSLSEVQPALARVFGPTLRLDGATRPAFLAGDFNGDGVADLAAAVRPNGEDALLELNDEPAEWGRQDAVAPPVTGRETVRLAAGDLLLAVIHGAEPSGWRNPVARQCYLVKNAVGAAMHRRPLAALPAALRTRVIRLHAGDVIVADRPGGPGWIVWDGARYIWVAQPGRDP